MGGRCVRDLQFKFENHFDDKFAHWHDFIRFDKLKKSIECKLQMSFYSHSIKIIEIKIQLFPLQSDTVADCWINLM